MSREDLEIAPQVRELLSDEQIEAVGVQLETGEAPCTVCGEPIDPVLSDSALLLLVDPGARSAAARVAHARCSDSGVIETELPDPGAARLAERWAAFVLPRVPALVLQARADVWTDEERPALLRMLGGLGFEPAREALDSDLFATGVGPPPRARGLELRLAGADLELVLADGTVLETLPGAAGEQLASLVAERAGAMVAIGPALGIPAAGESDAGVGIGFEQLLETLLDRALAAFVPVATG